MEDLIFLEFLVSKVALIEGLVGLATASAVTWAVTGVVYLNEVEKKEKRRIRRRNRAKNAAFLLFDSDPSLWENRIMDRQLKLMETDPNELIPEEAHRMIAEKSTRAELGQEAVQEEKAKEKEEAKNGGDRKTNTLFLANVLSCAVCVVVTVLAYVWK